MPGHRGVRQAHGQAQAALPHGSPGRRPLRAGQVLLFDFGAQVAGYRMGMLFGGAWLLLLVGRIGNRAAVLACGAPATTL